MADIAINQVSMRSAHKAATIALLFLSCPALAQMANCLPNGPFVNCYNTDGTYSACNSVGQTWNCQTYGGRRTASSTEASSHGGAARGIADFIARNKDNAVRKHVGEMLASGNCEGASRYAYSKGRLELAEHILQSCPSTAAAPPRQVQLGPSTANLADLLKRTAEAMRAEPNLEDHDFKLVRVEPVGGRLQMTIGVKSQNLAPITDDSRTKLVGAMCAEPTFMSLMQHGASIRIAFADFGGREFGAVMLTSQICGF